MPDVDQNFAHAIEHIEARTQPAYRNMRRAGFELAYVRQNLLYSIRPY